MRSRSAELAMVIGIVLNPGCPDNDDIPDSGTGDPSPRGTCGFEQECDTDQQCADFCPEICGDALNTEMGFCLASDSRCVCACIEGTCDRNPCLAGGQCNDDQDCADGDQDAGQDNCLAVCDGQEDLRDATCRPTGTCECICNASGLTACID